MHRRSDSAVSLVKFYSFRDVNVLDCGTTVKHTDGWGENQRYRIGGGAAVACPRLQLTRLNEWEDLGINMCGLVQSALNSSRIRQYNRANAEPRLSCPHQS